MMQSKSNGEDAVAGNARARLVLAIGSQRGREAPLRDGYYMIGRHQECQIRPKSRSVSRRHCLLYQDESGLQVLDLSSTAGTRVNDRRLPAKTWMRLRQGDTLRCGKVLFRIELGDGLATCGDGTSAMAVPGRNADAVPVGEAWHDLDVAGFLESQDDADRERRYDGIRSSNRSSSDDDGAGDRGADDLQSTSELDLDLFEDAFSEPQPQASATAAKASSPNGANHAVARDSSQEMPSSGAAATQVGGAAANQNSSQRNQQAKRRGDRPSRRSVPRSTSPRFGVPTLRIAGSADRLKVWGVTLCLLTALGVLGVSVYRFYTGPSVRVLQSID